jgi:hypothetical protein
MDNLFNTQNSLVPSVAVGTPSLMPAIIKNGDPSTNDENLIERNDRNILFKKVNIA